MARRCRRSALFISGLVLLAGCSSGKAASQNASHSASATAPVPVSLAAATVHIGPYTQEFAGLVVTDPAQANMVDGFREAQVLWVKSAEAWHLVAPVTQFVVGVDLSNLNRAIAYDKQRGVVAAGTDQFFMTKVTSVGANSATVSTCDNASKFKFIFKATGHIDKADAAPPNQAYLFENWGMIRQSGHWAISSVSVIMLPDPRAQPCQP